MRSKRRLRKAAMHSWKNSGRLASTASRNVTADIYIMRHGESTCNAWDAANRTDCPQDAESGYWDTSLTDLGIRQAQAAQAILKALGLAEVDGAKVQLGASMLSRAWDTLILAAAPLWRAWDQVRQVYVVHGVPALMEFGHSHESQRKVNVPDDDPTRWEDSALSKATNVGDFSQFYHVAEDKDLVTTKPVEIRTSYQRQWDGGSHCVTDQIDFLRQYLVDAARAGKEHLVLSSHGWLMRCAVKKLGGLPESVLTDQGSKLNLVHGHIPNVAVLHLKIVVPAGEGEPIFKMSRLYLSASVVA